VSDIIILHEIGRGAYGKVLLGELRCVSDDGTQIQAVAVRSLKRPGGLGRDWELGQPGGVIVQDEEAQRRFWGEAEVLSNLTHANIACLVGVSRHAVPVCMVFEYLGGDLHDFLQRHSPNTDIVPDCDVSGVPLLLRKPEMIWIVTQIAAGLEYLAARLYVHRDVAARNVQVASGGKVVKVSIVAFVNHTHRVYLFVWNGCDRFVCIIMGVYFCVRVCACSACVFSHKFWSKIFLIIV